MLPKQGLHWWGSHGIVLVPWISPTLWCRAVAKLPRSRAPSYLWLTAKLEIQESGNLKIQESGNLGIQEFGNLGIQESGNQGIWSPKKKEGNYQNANPFCLKGW